MYNSAIQVFQFESQKIRFIDGKPVAKDVASVLGYGNPDKYSDEDCCSVFDLLAIAVEFVEALKLEKAEKVFTFIKTFGMKQDGTSERLYHATRIHFAWKQSRIEEANKCVYLVGCVGNNTMKIGFTNSLDRRMRQLQIKASFYLELLANIQGTSYLKEQLHREFSHLHISNGWFKWSDDIIQKFENLQSLWELW